MRHLILRMLFFAIFFVILCTLSVVASALAGRGLSTTIATAVVNTGLAQSVNVASKVYLLDIDRGVRTRVKLPIFEPNLTGLNMLDQDGRQMVVSTLDKRTNRLYYINLVTRTRQLLMEYSPIIEAVSTLESFAPVWSPDGTKLAYWHPTSRATYVLDLVTFQQQQVWQPDDNFYSFYASPMWSPDSSRLLLSWNDELVVVEFGEAYAARGDVTLHSFKRNAEMFQIDWLGDSRHLLMLRHVLNPSNNQIRITPISASVFEADTGRPYPGVREWQAYAVFSECSERYVLSMVAGTAGRFGEAHLLDLQTGEVSIVKHSESADARRAKLVRWMPDCEWIHIQGEGFMGMVNSHDGQVEMITHPTTLMTTKDYAARTDDAQYYYANVAGGQWALVRQAPGSELESTPIAANLLSQLDWIELPHRALVVGRNPFGNSPFSSGLWLFRPGNAPRPLILPHETVVAYALWR